MAKPASARSMPDFALESFVQQFVASNARKALKLSFTSTRTIEPAFRVLAKHYDSLQVPVILNADIASWPTQGDTSKSGGACNSTQQLPVDAWTFLMLCRTRFPKAIISIGWHKPEVDSQPDSAPATSSPDALSKTQQVSQAVSQRNLSTLSLQLAGSPLKGASECLSSESLIEAELFGGIRPQVQPVAAHQQQHMLSQQLQAAFARQQLHSQLGFLGPVKSHASHCHMKLQSHPYAPLEPLQAAHSSHLQQRLLLGSSHIQQLHALDHYNSAHSSCSGLNLSNHRSHHLSLSALSSQQQAFGALSSANSLDSSSGTSSASPSPTSPSPLSSTQAASDFVNNNSNSNKSLSANDGCSERYTQQMIDKLASTVKEYNLSQPVTFPVEAKLIKHSVCELQRLLQQVGVNASLTIVANKHDSITNADILLIQRAFPTNQLMFDLPEEIKYALF